MSDPNFDGVLDAEAGWPDIPQASTEMLLLGGEDGPLNVQPGKLAQRTKLLKQRADNMDTALAELIDYVTVDASTGNLVPVSSFPNIPQVTGNEVAAVINAIAQALLNRTQLLKDVSDDAFLRGVVADGSTDSTAAFMAAAEQSALLPRGIIILNGAMVYGGNIQGRGMRTRLKAKAAATTVLKLGAYAIPTLWSPRKVSDLIIDGNNRSADGITISDDQTPYLAGRWTIDGVAITQANRGFVKPAGNIGCRLRDFAFSECNIGYEADGQTSPLMHGGSDLLQAGELSACYEAAIYINSPQAGTGGSAYRDLIIEGNYGFGVFVEAWADSYCPLIFDNVWFEVNCINGTATVKGTTYTARHMRLKNAAYVVIQNGMMPPSLEMINSRLIIENSSINDGPNQLYQIDATSHIIGERLSIDGGIHPLIVNSLVRARRQMGNQAQVHYAPPREYRLGSTSNNTLQALPFNGAGPFTFTGTSNVNGTSVADGLTFASCCELTIPNGYTLFGAQFTAVAGLWYVITVNAKLTAGTKTGFSFGALDGITLTAGFDKLLTSGWRTIASVGQCISGGTARMAFINATGGDVTVRFEAWQVAHFNTEREAIEYYNNRTYFK